MHVLRVSQAAATAVRRVSVLIVGPGLDVERVEGIGEVDVLCANIFDCFEAAFVLPDGADGDAEAVVEVRVENADVGAVGLEGDAVVAIIDGPVFEG